MKLFESELRYLSELYSNVNTEIQRHFVAGRQENLTALADFILRNRDLFCRVEQMNTRLSQLTAEWEKFRQHIDPNCRNRALQIAAVARQQAQALQDFCSQRVEAMEKRCSELESKLQETNRGARYLESLKPVKANFPKFVDSHG